MAVLQTSDFVLVALNDPLDFRLEAFDSLSPDLVNLFLLPLLFTDFLSCDPGVFVLFELDLKPIVDDFLLAVDRLVPSLDRLNKVFNLLAQLLLVLKERLYHVDLLLDPLLHVLPDRLSNLLALFFHDVNLFVRLRSFLLAELFEELQLFFLLLFLDLKLDQPLSDLLIGLAGLL